jgi:osmotically-inducible protein OsmY
MNRILAQGNRIRAASLGLLILFTTPMFSACVPVLIGAATITTINVVTDRRTVGRNMDDNTLELDLRKEFVLDDELNGTNVSVTAINGIVLLTGEVANDSQRRHAEEVAKSRIQTLSVVNELQLAGSTSITSRTNDTLITSQVKTRLVTSKEVPANAVKVVTEGGKVYLLGLVTRAEADAAVRSAQEVGGVTHIVKVFEYLD